MNKVYINVDKSAKYQYFLLTFDDAFVLVGGGICKSILKNTDEKVCFIVFTENLNEDSLNKLKAYNIPFIIYFVSGDKIKYDASKYFWPRVSVIRLIAPFIIEEEMDYLYYLDCDFLCINKLDDLFKLHIKTSVAICPELIGNIIQRCEDYPTDNLYCNSGFIIFNISKYKENYTEDKIISAFNDMVDNLRFPDQDFLNVYFKDDATYLNPIKYNLQLRVYVGSNNKFIKAHLLDNTVLLHFTTREKPWKNNCWLVIAKTYRKYNVDLEMDALVKKAMCWHRVLYIPRLIKRILRKIYRIVFKGNRK